MKKFVCSVCGYIYDEQRRARRITALHPALSGRMSRMILSARCAGVGKDMFEEE